MLWGLEVKLKHPQEQTPPNSSVASAIIFYTRPWSIRCDTPLFGLGYQAPTYYGCGRTFVSLEFAESKAHMLNHNCPSRLIPSSTPERLTTTALPVPQNRSFTIQSGSKSYKHQYSNIYFTRLRLLRKFVEDRAKKRWKDVAGKSKLDLAYPDLIANCPNIV